MLRDLRRRAGDARFGDDGRESFFDDKAVRRAAMMAGVPCITTITGAAAALEGLRPALQDDDREVRIAAVRGLAAAKYLPARAAVEAVVAGKAIRDADLTEQMAFFEAFGAMAGAEHVPLLDRLLNGRRLFGRHTPELRACAAMALGRMSAPAARSALQKAATDPSPIVRNAIGKALRGESPAP